MSPDPFLMAESSGEMTSPSTAASPSPPPAKTTSSLHSSLRVVTTPGELGVSFPPPSLGKWTPLRSPSLLLSPLGLLSKPKGASGDASDANVADTVALLGDAYESPQSVYALLGAGAFSPLHGSRLSPLGHPQSFLSHLQSPLLAMSPVGAFYPPSVTIPSSPPPLSAHLLSPMFASAASPGGGLGVSPDMLSMAIDPATVFVPPGSPSALLRHLLPPVAPRAGALNVKELTLNELRPHFNKPMAVVAKELGVCITLMKKICRRNGLVRWPHRRIRSLVNRITSLQVIAGTAVGAEKKRFQAQIAALRDELSAVIQNPNEKSRKAQADAKSRSPPPAGAHAASSRKRRASHIASEDDDDGEEDDDDDELYGDENASVQATARRDASLKKEPLAKAPRKSAKAAAARPATAVAPSKRSARFRSPPPIQIPRRSEYEAARRELEAELGEQPSSTTSTGSNGKRGSISSILC